MASGLAMADHDTADNGMADTRTKISKRRAMLMKKKHFPKGAFCFGYIGRARGAICSSNKQSRKQWSRSEGWRAQPAVLILPSNMGVWAKDTSNSITRSPCRNCSGRRKHGSKTLPSFVRIAIE
jgi:hypothetical protein